MMYQSQSKLYRISHQFRQGYGTINLVLLGEVSVGKSTLVNALVSDKIANTSIRRCTATVTNYVEKMNKDSKYTPKQIREELKVNEEKYGDFHHNEPGQGVKMQKLEQKEYYIPPITNFLETIREKKYRFNLVDVPGFNDRVQDNLLTKFLQDNCQLFDVVIVMFDAQNAFNKKSDQEFLTKVLKSLATWAQQGALRILFVLNKFDDPEDSEYQDQAEWATKKIQKECKNHKIQQKYYRVCRIAARTMYYYRTLWTKVTVENTMPNFDPNEIRKLAKAQFGVAAGKWKKDQQITALKNKIKNMIHKRYSDENMIGEEELKNCLTYLLKDIDVLFLAKIKKLLTLFYKSKITSYSLKYIQNLSQNKLAAPCRLEILQILGKYIKQYDDLNLFAKSMENNLLIFKPFMVDLGPHIDEHFVKLSAKFIGGNKIIQFHKLIASFNDFWKLICISAIKQTKKFFEVNQSTYKVYSLQEFDYLMCKVLVPTQHELSKNQQKIQIKHLVQQGRIACVKDALTVISIIGSIKSPSILAIFDMLVTLCTTMKIFSATHFDALFAGLAKLKNKHIGLNVDAASELFYISLKIANNCNKNIDEACVLLLLLHQLVDMQFITWQNAPKLYAMIQYSQFPVLTTPDMMIKHGGCLYYKKYGSISDYFLKTLK